jgi:hypothetical protein
MQLLLLLSAIACSDQNKALQARNTHYVRNNAAVLPLQVLPLQLLHGGEHKLGASQKMMEQGSSHQNKRRHIREALGGRLHLPPVGRQVHEVHIDHTTSIVWLHCDGHPAGAPKA